MPTDEVPPQADLFAPRALDLVERVLGGTLTVCGPEGTVAVRLTEIEAYEGESDPGSHGFRGRTARNAPMFDAGGRLYVYYSYGMHWCANLVCGPQGTCSAILLRGGEIVEGADAARTRREAARRPGSAHVPDAHLARGPANLARALGLEGADSGRLLDPAERAWFTPAGAGASAEVRTGPRVGVSGPAGSGETHPWRFWLPGEPSVSAYRPAVARTRGARGAH